MNEPFEFRDRAAKKTWKQVCRISKRTRVRIDEPYAREFAKRAMLVIPFGFAWPNTLEQIYQHLNKNTTLSERERLLTLYFMSLCWAHGDVLQRFFFPSRMSPSELIEYVDRAIKEPWGFQLESSKPS